MLQWPGLGKAALTAPPCWPAFCGHRRSMTFCTLREIAEHLFGGLIANVDILSSAFIVIRSSSRETLLLIFDGGGGST